MNYLFVFIGLIVGFLQYALLKTLVSYMVNKKGALGVAAIKVGIYLILAAVIILWFHNLWVYCMAGVATGILLTAFVDYIRNKKK